MWSEMKTADQRTRRVPHFPVNQARGVARLQCLWLARLTVCSSHTPPKLWVPVTFVPISDGTPPPFQGLVPISHDSVQASGRNGLVRSPAVHDNLRQTIKHDWTTTASRTDDKHIRQHGQAPFARSKSTTVTTTKLAVPTFRGPARATAKSSPRRRTEIYSRPADIRVPRTTRPRPLTAERRLIRSAEDGREKTTVHMQSMRGGQSTSQKAGADSRTAVHTERRRCPLSGRPSTHRIGASDADTKTVPLAAGSFTKKI